MIRSEIIIMYFWKVVATDKTFFSESILQKFVDLIEEYFVSLSI